MSEDHLDPYGAARLYSVARALTGALTAVEVATCVFDRLAELGAASTGLWLVESGTVRFVGGAGVTEAIPGSVSTLPLDSDLPAAEAIRTGRVITFGSRAERNRRWPVLAVVDSDAEGTAVLPLQSSGRALGCLHIAYPAIMEPDDFDASFLTALAELCSAALDRAQLYDAERERRDFLLDASSAVAGAGGFAETLERLASVAVPRLADLCLIDVAEGAGQLRRMAAVHSDPSAQPLVDELLTRYQPEPGGPHPASHAVAEGRSLWRSDMSDEYLRSTTRDEHHFELTRRLGFQSFMSVPLRAAGEVLGAITLVSAGSGRRFGASDLALAEELAERVAEVVAAARRHEREREVAHTLQRLLLPDSLPNVDGLEVSARYMTAHRDTEAGGDFYDVVRLPSGRVGFVIGDVEGHDPVAAAIMGQLRSAMRALAGQRREPDLLIDALRWSWDLLGFNRMATCLVGRLDPTDGTMVLCSAGHLPPILIGADGSTELLQVPGAPPLGAPTRPARQSQHMLPEGATVFMYTDGQVEGTKRGIDTEIEALTRLLGGCPGASADAICDRVLAAHPNGGGRPDDVAVLALHRCGDGRAGA